MVSKVGSKNCTAGISEVSNIRLHVAYSSFSGKHNGSGGGGFNGSGSKGVTEILEVRG